MRRLGLIALLVSTASLFAATPAGASTKLIDFDALATGSTVTTIEGVTFVGGPKVFDPVHVATVSEPNALHSKDTCVGGGTTCPTGANKLELTLAEPAGLVGMYVGLDDETAEAEFGESVRLVAYDGGGGIVADTGTEAFNLGSDTYKPIKTHVFVSSDEVDIKKVVLTVGALGTPRRVNVDNVEVIDEAVVFSPPSVKIESPANGAEFDRADDLRVSGRALASTGVLRFCLTVSGSPPGGFPAECSQLGQLSEGVNTFTDLRVGPLVTGTNHITAWVEDRQLHQVHETIDVVLRGNDLRIANMEVTQAVQNALPKPTPDDLNSAHAAGYEGVPLVNDKSTVVRVWTGAQLDPAGNPVHGAAVYLYGEKADGTPLPGGPIPAKEGARDIGPSLSFGSLIDNRTWSDATTSWTFLLPFAWQQTGGPITLRAVVNPPAAYPHVNECAGCEANNALRLTGVRFQRPHTLNLYPFRVLWRDDAGKLMGPPASSWPVFRRVIEVSPFDINVHPYAGVLNGQAISEDASLDGDAKTSAVYDRLTDAVDIMGYPGFFTLAVNVGLGPGVTAAHFSWQSFTVRTYAVVEANRPLTSVGHEIYHSIDYEHAGIDCDEAAQRGGAEFWPPEDHGLLEGVGTEVSSVWTPPRKLRLFGFFEPDGTPTENFDLMSYCFTDEAHTWISGLNWTRAVSRVASATGSSAAQTAGAARPRPAAASAGGPNLGVSAEIGAGGGHILRVEPGKGRVNAPVSSSVSLRVRNKDGNVVSETPVLVQPSHVDLGHHGSDVLEVSAVVPAAGAASVELVSNGVVLDTVRRSASKPKARLLAPKAGARVGSAGTLQARWSASDPDGGRLLSSLDFSADGGKHWKAVLVDAPGNHYALPVSYLSHTDNARLRVRVNDGWDEAASVSGRFSVKGPPPSVQIEAPRGKARFRAGDPINLEGFAFDDRSRSLSGRRLRWYDRREPLGHGERLTLLELFPGKHTIELEATDRSGRRGRDSVTITVTPAKPAFTVLEAPKSVSRKARKVKIRAASSLAGNMVIGNFRYAVDRRPQKFTVHVKPGKGPLHLTVTLNGGGLNPPTKLSTRAKLTIPRR